jgi:uncharacterized membrane protein
MFADLTAYNVGVFIHVVAVVIGLGATYAYPVVLAWVERFAPESVPATYKALQRCDRLLVTPGLIIILLAGFYVVSEGKIKVSESWVSLGIFTVIVLLGITHAYFAPRWRKGIELAERDLASSSGELGDEFKANSRQMALAGMATSLLVLVTIFFMVVKP